MERLRAARDHIVNEPSSGGVPKAFHTGSRGGHASHHQHTGTRALDRVHVVKVKESRQHRFQGAARFSLTVVGNQPVSAPRTRFLVLCPGLELREGRSTHTQRPELGPPCQERPLCPRNSSWDAHKRGQVSYQLSSSLGCATHIQLTEFQRKHD